MQTKNLIKPAKLVKFDLKTEKKSSAIKTQYTPKTQNAHKWPL